MVAVLTLIDMDKDLVLHRNAWRLLDSVGAVKIIKKFRSTEFRLESINVLRLIDVTEKDLRVFKPHGDKIIAEALKIRETILQSAIPTNGYITGIKQQ